MPNLVMEYTQPIEDRLNTQGLLQDLHQTLIDSDLFDVSSIVSRAQRCHTWLIANQEDMQDFIQVAVSLPPAATTEQKAMLSEQLLEVLRRQAPWVNRVIVEVRNIDPAGYRECNQA